MRGIQRRLYFCAIRQKLLAFFQALNYSQRRSAASELKPFCVKESEHEDGAQLSPDRAAEHQRCPSSHRSWKSLTSAVSSSSVKGR